MDTTRKTILYYFTGTGNSYALAKEVHKNIKGSIFVAMTGKRSKELVPKVGDSVGFIFPSYYGTLPRAVKQFVSQLILAPNTYCFSLVTMGLIGGNALLSLKQSLIEKGGTLHYGRAIKMPRNYIVAYNPLNPTSSVKLLQHAYENVPTIAAEIQSNKKHVEKHLKFGSDKLYQEISDLDQTFTVTHNCIHCKRCEQICPVQNIKLIRGVPTWLHKCEHCMACISWCPQEAIQYGEKTKNRRRYQNPHVNAAELIDGLAAD